MVGLRLPLIDVSGQVGRVEHTKAPTSQGSRKGGTLLSKVETRKQTMLRDDVAYTLVK